MNLRKPLSSVGVLVFVIGTACSNAAPAAAPTATTVPAAAGPVGGDAGQIHATAEAMAAASSFRILVKSTTSDGQVTTGTMEIVRPDRMHYTATTPAGRTVETVIIGQDMYLLNNGKWQHLGTAKAPVPTTLVTTIDPDTSVKAFNNDVVGGATLTRGEQVSVDGTTCQQFTMSSPPPRARNGTLCVGADNLPRQYTDDHTLLTFSDWNTPITIEAPI
jgi:hypothetical protein